MSFNTILLCASAFFIQSIAGQCCRSISLPSSCGCGAVSNNGGAFNVQSIGPIVPAGIATATDLNLAADLGVSGTVPFLSAVEFGGQLPTSGAASVSYGCGDGNIAISQQLGNSAAYGLRINSLGNGGYGCGCGCGC